MWRRAASVCMVALATAMLMLILVEWLAGCGEIIYNEDGTWRTGECVFLTTKTGHGKW